MGMPVQNTIWTAEMAQLWQPHDQRPQILDDWIEWNPVPDIEPLRIDLAEYFRDFLG